MQTPPAHVLARLDDIIVGQEEAKDGGGAPPRHVLLQNCDDDDDDDAAFGIECSATSFSEPVEDDSGGARTTTSRFWGVTWNRNKKKWQAQYTDADNATQYLGVFTTQEAAAHRVNAAIETLPAHVQRRRRKNEVDAATGKLLPRNRIAPGHGPRCDRYRQKPTAPHSKRARRPRRAVNFDEFQPDDEDGWD